jgi:hypothetical protein
MIIITIISTCLCLNVVDVVTFYVACFFLILLAFLYSDNLSIFLI